MAMVACCVADTSVCLAIHQPPLGVTFSADDDKENESAALGKQANTRQQLQALFRESGMGAREFLELTQSVIQPRTAEFE